MTFILDASVTAAWLLPDEKHPLGEKCRLRLISEAALVPAIWWFEVRNLLIVAERRGRMTSETTRTALEILARHSISEDTDVEDQQLLDVARRHSLTIYDAAYLELAQRTGFPLATLDRRLASAVQAAGLRAFE
ncbi:type II toxin-antitoxin system VapC family toxin [Aquamicrobium sp. LC103]|uniref:type II toxin-antitoxin system VapC family toxin n=1 Tax=Aquamicrobium sp. LC103 TaxID=1120658 RepID=UPI00063E8B5D|nr:type II toxin-antitoxin system VapC family toxin [Aquamicrobium sp. LC103]TKT80943.1 type II toxin-antitoxin system VapC family toxin [Aquamicrobium sp. LC103]